LAPWVRIDGDEFRVDDARIIWSPAVCANTEGIAFWLRAAGTRSVFHLAGWAPGSTASDLDGQEVRLENPGPDAGADGRFLASALVRFGRVSSERAVVSIDGANCELVQKAAMPNLHRLAAEGAHTWQARTILPSKTLPSHTSLLTGVDIARHQIDWNDYFPMRGMVKVPTVFSLAKAARPEITTALFCGKIKFRHLWSRRESLDVFDCGGAYEFGPIPASEDKKLVPAPQVAERAAAWIVEKKPRLCFVHFPDVDSAGHLTYLCDHLVGNTRQLPRVGAAYLHLNLLPVVESTT
jgi:hypothetical protein